MGTFPVLLSIPHGGTKVPAELKNRLAIGKNGLFEDTDPFTQRIYDLKDKVKFVTKANVARAFIDPSRSATDLPPENPDGVIKSHTCFGKVIYKQDQQPNKSEIAFLLEKYYAPYHHQIQEIILAGRNDLKICFDCHSMAEIGPQISPDTGESRPLICLGNRFGASAEDAVVYKLKSCFVTAFELKETDVTINKPFAGGFITNRYGNNPLPWVQIEMNRKLYLKEPWFNSETLKISKSKIDDLNNKFFLALKMYFS
ncbi:MAG: N-formylglutamate amidohydrolase [Acidobacteriota bacterium]